MTFMYSVYDNAQTRVVLVWGKSRFRIRFIYIIISYAHTAHTSAYNYVYKFIYIPAALSTVPKSVFNNHSRNYGLVNV